MNKTLRASILLGLAGCSYALYLTIIKLANYAGYYRAELMTGQYLIAMLILGVLLLFKYKKGERVKLKFNQIFKFMIIGFFAFACGVCMYENVALTSTSFAVTMMFQYVWIGILFDCILTRSLPSKRVIAATILVVAGTPLAAGFFSSTTNITPVGLMWGIAAAMFYAAMLWSSARFETEVPALTRTFWTVVSQTLFASLVSLNFYTVALQDPGLFIYVVPLALTAGIIPVLLIMKNSPLVSIGITNIMTGSELPVVVIFGVVILGESLTVLHAIGVIVICAGIIVANWDSAKPLKVGNESADTDKDYIDPV